MRARRWLEYDWVATKKWQQIVRNSPWPKSQALVNEASQVELWRETVDKEADRIKKKYGRRSRDYWSGKSLEQMAQEVDLVDQYTVYRVYSETIHAGVKGVADSKLHNYLPLFRFNLGKDVAHSEACLGVAAQCLGITYVVIDDILGLNIEHHLQAGVSKLKRIS